METFSGSRLSNAPAARERSSVRIRGLIAAGVCLLGIASFIPVAQGDPDGRSIFDRPPPKPDGLEQPQAVRPATQPSSAPAADSRGQKPTFVPAGAPGSAETTTKPVDGKLPVPDIAAQQKSETLLRALFSDDIANARTADQKTALARRLLQLGTESPNDPAGRYVSWVRAKELAIEAGSVDGALAATQQLAYTYEIDSLDLQCNTVTRLTKAAVPPSQRTLLFTGADALFDTAASVGRYDLVKQTADTLAALATRIGDPKSNARARERAKEAVDLSSAYDEAEKAILVLEKDKSNSHASGILGKFTCFTKDDWKTGLPLLAGGDDPALKALAQKEAATTNRDPMALADGWWDISAKLEGTSKAHVQARAVALYREAEPNATGLSRLKIEKRIEEFEARASGSAPAWSATPPPAPVPERPREILIAIAKHNLVEGMTYAEACHALMNRPALLSTEGNTKVYRWTIKGDRHHTVSYRDIFGHVQSEDVPEYGILGYIDATFTGDTLSKFKNVAP